MLEHENPVTRTDLEHDLSRLITNGADALDVVVFQDIRQMGAPLALSKAVRDEIYSLAVHDLMAQVGHRQEPATA